MDSCVGSFLQNIYRNMIYVIEMTSIFFKTTEQLTYFSRSLIEIWYVMSLFGYVNQQQQWTGKELSVSKRSMKIVLWLFTVSVCVCVCAP